MLERGEYFIGEAFDAVGAGHISEPRAPEAHRIDQRFA